MTNIHKITEKSIARAAEIILAGGIIALPTDTVYGLSGGVGFAGMSEQINRIKGRPDGQPLIVHIADIEELDRLLERSFMTPPNLPLKGEEYKAILALANRFWPGALTLKVLPDLRLRIPDCEPARQVIRLAGMPVYSTSANLHDRPAPLTAEEVYDQLGDAAEMILDGGTCAIGVASTLLDVTSRPFTIIREGAVSAEELKEF